ncbi:hypothetical protein T492DRAFT_896705, partial [Pavlovales sp. CCMP2436]
MVQNQSAGSLIPSAGGWVEMERPRVAPPRPGAVSAQVQQRRRRLKELLVTQLAKQFGATANSTVRAICEAEAEAALAKGTVSPDDIRALERNIRKTINMTTTGTFEGARPTVDARSSGERVNWQALTEFKKVHGDEAERAKLQRDKGARELLTAQIRQQIAEKDGARARAVALEAQHAREAKEELARRNAVEAARVAAFKAKVGAEIEANNEHIRIAAKRRAEEAHIRQLEDERMLAKMRGAAEAAKGEKARLKTEKAKRFEFALLQNERSERLKADERAAREAEQARLDAVMTQMQDAQEKKRENGMRRVFEQQQQRQVAYGKSAGAEMLERARRDEVQMLRELQKQEEVEHQR